MLIHNQDQAWKWSCHWCVLRDLHLERLSFRNGVYILEWTSLVSTYKPVNHSWLSEYDLYIAQIAPNVQTIGKI